MGFSELFKKTLLVCFALLSISISGYSQNSIPGEISKSYNVTNNGAFTYSIPLTLPPGLNSLVPELALVYNSQSGPGLLGYGWTLSGLSAITRGPATIYHDSQIDPVDFDADDVYYLDGQRLVPENGGTSYNTEIKNFAEIQTLGSYGTAPSTFTVKNNDGIFYEYDHKIIVNLPNSTTAVFQWLLSKVYDPNGNYIEFTYHSAQDRHVIAEIKYGQNIYVPGLLPVRVEFDLAPKIDANTTWVAGAVLHNHRVVNRVRVFHPNGTLTNTYELFHNNGKHHYLEKVVEKRNGANTGSEILINYGSASSNTPVSVTTQHYHTQKKIATGDYDGDGITDYLTTPIQKPINSSDRIWELYINNKQNDFTKTTSGQLANITGYYNPMSGLGRNNNQQLSLDYNGDGNDDLVVFSKESTLTWSRFSLDLYLSNGLSGPQAAFGSAINLYAYTHNYNPPGTALSPLANNVKLVPGDYDGDGKKEVLMCVPEYISGQLMFYKAYIMGIEYNSNNYVGQILGRMETAFAGDFDGDGKEELYRVMADGVSPAFDVSTIDITYNPTSKKPSLTTPSSSFVRLYSHSYPYHLSSVFSGDFNGDGKRDMLVWTASGPNYPQSAIGTWEFIFSKGDGVDYAPVAGTPIAPILPTSGTYQTNNNRYSFHVGDFNGDGMDDVLQLNNASWPSPGADYDMLYSRGYSGSASANLHNFAHESGYIANLYADYQYFSIGDFNGDGQADLFDNYSGASYPRLIQFLPDNKSHLVESIEHYGNTVSVEYESLTKDPDYVDNSLFSYPYLCKPAGMKVVKRMYDGVTLDMSYKYKGMVRHLKGLGYRGFTEFETENIAGQETISYYDQVNYRTPMLLKTEELQTPPMSVTLPVPVNAAITTEYSYYDHAGSTNTLVRILGVQSTEVTDLVKGYRSVTTNNLGSVGAGSVFYKYGVPESVEEVIKSSAVGTFEDVSNKTSYVYDPNAPFINGAKPITTTTTTTLGLQNSYVRTEKFTYNSSGQLTSNKVDPGTAEEIINSFTYDAVGNVKSSLITVVATGDVRRIDKNYTPDYRFLLNTTKDQGGLNEYEEYKYDGAGIASWGMPIYHLDANGQITFTEYDDYNRITKILTNNNPQAGNPDQIEKTISYDWAVNSSNNPTGVNSNIVITRRTTGVIGSNETFYDLYGREVRVASSNFDGSDFIYEDTRYNNMGLVRLTKAPYPASNPSLAVTTGFSYDGWGREHERSTNNNKITTVYEIHHDGSPQNDVYISAYTNDPSSGYRKAYSAAGAYTFKVEDNSNTIDYTFAPNGEHKFITLNNDINLRTQFEYDFKGRLIKRIEPNAGEVNFTYDPLDQLVTEELTSGAKYRYTYDNLGRVTQKEHINSGLWPNPYYVYTYAPSFSLATGHQGSSGQLIKVELMPVGSFESYIYDTYGRLEHKEENDNQSFSAITEYTYDHLSRVATRLYPNGDEIGYEYNVWGNLEKVKLNNSHHLPAQDLWKATGVNHHGQVTKATYFNDLNQDLYKYERTYNKDAFPFTQTLTNVPVNQQIFSRGYLFNVHNGNLTQRDNFLNGSTETFSYDALERLTQVQYNFLNPVPPQVPNLQMSYDNVGNILKKDDVTNTLVDWKYDRFALSIVPEPQNTPNQTFIIPQVRQIKPSYTPFNKVNNIIEENLNEVKFIYGPKDGRIKTEHYDITNSAMHVHYKNKYYASNYEKIEYLNSGPSADIEELNYIWAKGELVAILSHKDFPSQGQNVSEIYYTVTDYQGSITHVLDNTGVANNGLLEERSYDAWGRFRDPVTYQPYEHTDVFFGNMLFDRGYTGHEHIVMHNANTTDYYLNVINMNGRLYDPLIGRMFSPDPVVTDVENSQDLNKYTYARNNPLKYTDPSGRSAIGMMAIGAVFGGAMNVVVNGGNIKTWGDGFGYFAVGASAGLIGGAVGQVAVGAGSVVAGAAGGAAGGLISGAGNAWLGGANFGGGLVAGLKSAGSGALSGAVSGAIRSKIAKMQNRAMVRSILNKSKATGKPPKSVEYYFEQAIDYNKSPEMIAKDGELKVEMEKAFRKVWGNVTTRTNTLQSSLPTHGFDPETTLYVDEDGDYVSGFVSHNSLGAKPWVHISPAVLAHAGTATHYKFLAVAGHEVVHAIQYSKASRSDRMNWGYFSDRTEYTAWRYSYEVYKAAGDIPEMTEALNNSRIHRTQTINMGSYWKTIPNLK